MQKTQKQNSNSNIYDYVYVIYMIMLTLYYSKVVFQFAHDMYIHSLPINENGIILLHKFN